MRITHWFKIFIFSTGILITSIAVFSFNHFLISKMVTFLNVEPFLVSKGIKYLTQYRLIYLVGGIILSLISFSLINLAWNKKLKLIFSFLDKTAENLDGYIMSNYKYQFPQNKKFPERKILFFSLSLSLIFGIILAWKDIGLILGRFVYDDLFCYLKFARNVVSGHGPTFDGINRTNGFHPLWMLLSIFLQFFFFPYPNLIVHLILSISAILHVLIAYFIYKVISFLGYRFIAIGAAIFWALNYNIMSISLSGLETPLFGLLLLVTLYLYLKWRNHLTILRSIIIGVLAAITVLARFDGILFIIFLCIDYILIGSKRMHYTLSCLSLILGTCFLLILPWFVWSYLTVGCFLPITFQAKGPFQNIFPELNLFLSCLKRLLLQIGWWHYSLQSYLRTIGAHSLWGKLVWLALLIIILPSLKKIRQAILPVKIFFFYALAHFTYYALLVPTVRYLYPSIIILILTVALTLGYNSYFLKKKVSLLVIFLPILFTCIIADSIYAWKDGRAGVEQHSEHATMYYDVVGWIKKNTPSTAIIGSFNSGIYGYYSDRCVVNLDGFINNNSYYAIKEKRLFKYIKEQKIDYLVDWNKEDIEENFQKFGGERDFQKHFVLLNTIEQKWGPYKGKKVFIYKIIY